MRVFSGQQKVISTYLQKRSIFLNVCSRKDINKIKQKQNKQTTKKSRCFITPLSVKRWKDYFILFLIPIIQYATFDTFPFLNYLI